MTRSLFTYTSDARSWAEGTVNEYAHGRMASPMGCVEAIFCFMFDHDLWPHIYPGEKYHQSHAHNVLCRIVVAETIISAVMEKLYEGVPDVDDGSSTVSTVPELYRPCTPLIVLSEDGNAWKSTQVSRVTNDAIRAWTLKARIGALEKVSVTMALHLRILQEGAHSPASVSISNSYKPLYDTAVRYTKLLEEKLKQQIASKPQEGAHP